MNNSLKKFVYSGVGLYTLFFMFLKEPFANGFGQSTYNPEKLKGNEANDMVLVAENVLYWIAGLLYFVAVVICLWGGFQILTAGGDEEKVKKGKSTIVRGIIGLVVIFLAYSIVSWLFGLFSGDGVPSGNTTAQ